MSENEQPKGIPIAAAAGLLWRSTSKGLQIALVHRSRYDDWTLPKGKLKPGETWLEGALREVKEETGRDVRVLGFAGVIAYETDKGPKIVRFWNMTINGEGQSSVDTSEVVEVVWLSPSDATERLSGKRVCHSRKTLPKLCSVIALLVMGWPSTGQVSAEFYRRIVETRLKELKSLSRLAGDLSDDLASAVRKLDRQLTDETRESPAWKDVKDTQDKVDRGLQGFSKLLQTGVAGDEEFLGRLHRSGEVSNRGATENLAASIRLQRAIAQALSSFVDLLEQQATATKGLPETARDLPEFSYLKKVRDATVDALEDAGRVCRKRAADYESILSDFRR